MSKSSGENRRDFLKKSGMFTVAGVSCSLFPSCAGAQDAAQSEAAEAAENAKVAASMSEEFVKSKRKELWKKYKGRFRGPDGEFSDEKYKGPGKWRIHMLGTCAGTEPWPGRNHTSWILEKPNGEILWFDAGEYCSWTALLMNLDPSRCKNLFISHPHMDHVGGLPGLLTTIAKVHWLRGDKKPVELTVHSAMSYFIEASKEMVLGRNNKHVKIHTINTGEIFRDGDVAIDVIENRHMPPAKDGRCQSYSYRIKILNGPKKTLVFSGDIKNEDDLAPFFKDGGIDLLMIETGHHVAENLCRKIKEKYPNSVKDILFLHHGIEILNDPDFEKARAEAVWGKPVIISKDRQTIDL